MVLLVLKIFQSYDHDNMISICYEKAWDWPNKYRNCTVENEKKVVFLFFKLLDLTAFVSGKITSVYSPIMEILGQKVTFSLFSQPKTE